MNDTTEKQEKIETAETNNTKPDETLKELLGGILAAGILFQIIFMWLAKDKIAYSVGLWIGILLACFLAWHMWKTIDEALDMGEAGAQKMMRKNSMLRYVVIIIVLGALMHTEAANPLSAFLGIMALKVAAYLQPVTHKAISRLRR